MTRARVESVPADPRTARVLLAQAEEQLASARAPAVDNASAYTLVYQAVLKALIAVLLAQGARVTSGTGGHGVIISRAREHLPTLREKLRRVDFMRRTRHQLVYDVEEITDSERADGLTDARAVLDAVAERLA